MAIIIKVISIEENTFLSIFNQTSLIHSFLDYEQYPIFLPPSLSLASRVSVPSIMIKTSPRSNEWHTSLYFLKSLVVKFNLQHASQLSNFLYLNVNTSASGFSFTTLVTTSDFEKDLLLQASKIQACKSFIGLTPCVDDMY